MSVVQRYTEEQAAEWQTRAPEPLNVDVPGWARRDLAGEADGMLPNERLIQLERDAAHAEIFRFWDRPLFAGSPMAIASTSAIRIDGRDLELHLTSIFNGRTCGVHACFIPGKDWFVRITFESCSPDDISEIAGGIRFT